MSVKPLSIKTHIVFWIAVSILFLSFIWVFKSMLLPFVLGMAVAYLLNPVVGKLGAFGFARGPAALIILGCFLVLVLGSAIAVSPIIYREIIGLIEEFPTYVEKITVMLAPVTAMLDDYIGGENAQSLEEVVKSHSGTVIGAITPVLSKIASGGQAAVDMVSVLVFMPIVAYFMMKEWPAITGWCKDLMPRHSRGVIMDLLCEIDTKIAGFVRGQITVAFFLGISYAVILTLVGLKYGFMIGLMSGFISIIPMVGSAVGLIVSVAVAWFQAGDVVFVLLVAGIFLGGQVIEGNFLTPKLVGDSVGLHPLWVFFALLAGGSLLGILGMFLSVPVAAVIGVLCSFAIERYKRSAYYLESDIEEIDGKGKTTSKKSIAKKPSKVVKKTQKSKKDSDKKPKKKN